MRSGSGGESCGPGGQLGLSRDRYGCYAHSSKEKWVKGRDICMEKCFTGAMTATPRTPRMALTSAPRWWRPIPRWRIRTHFSSIRISRFMSILSYHSSARMSMNHTHRPLLQHIHLLCDIIDTCYSNRIRSSVSPYAREIRKCQRTPVFPRV